MIISMKEIRVFPNNKHREMSKRATNFKNWFGFNRQQLTVQARLQEGGEKNGPRGGLSSSPHLLCFGPSFSHIKSFQVFNLS